MASNSDFKKGPGTVGEEVSAIGERIKGAVKTGAGHLTGNEEMVREGRIEKAVGNIRQSTNDVVDPVQTSSSPTNLGNSNFDRATAAGGSGNILGSNQSSSFGENSSTGYQYKDSSTQDYREPGSTFDHTTGSSSDRITDRNSNLGVNSGATSNDYRTTEYSSTSSRELGTSATAATSGMNTSNMGGSSYSSSNSGSSGFGSSNASNPDLSSTSVGNSTFGSNTGNSTFGSNTGNSGFGSSSVGGAGLGAASATNSSARTGRLVTGVFQDRHEAERAYNELKSRFGFGDDDISIIMSDTTRQQHFGNVKAGDEFKSGRETNSVEGIGVGSALGGTLGAIVGAIAAIGTNLIIPGAGLVLAGPIAAAFAGAGVGGAAGGLIGGLVGAGIPEDRAREYDQHLRSGGIVLGAHARNEQEAVELENYLRSHGAEATRR